jgi:hypothetical protein
MQRGVRAMVMSCLASFATGFFGTIPCLGENAAVAPAPKLEQVIVVFKTHFDIGYTDLARNVVDRYRTSMIDKALDVCDSTDQLPPDHRFVWTVPGWPMRQILWPGQTRGRRERLERAIREGRLVWHALPGSLHTESLDLEDIVRGLRFSSDLSRAFDMESPRDAKMTDVPSHAWILPTILKHAGVEFLHLGCNSASASPDVPRLFWWEGPDGSRLLTMYEASGYGSGLKPPEDWPHKTWLALIHTGDNHGPPTPDEVRFLLDRAKEELPEAKIRMGRLADFGDAILQENPDLPVVRGDMPDTWIHGIMSMPVESKLARNLRPEIGALEILNSLLSIWGVAPPPASKTITAAYEGSLMYGEHTWGHSVPLNRRLYGKAWEEARARGEYARLEESWQEHGAYIRGAQDLVAPALADTMTALAGAVAVEGPRVVVFNPLPWTRDDVVTVAVSDGLASGLKDLDSGETVPVEVGGDRLRFIARGLPPLGYRTYVPGAAQSTSKGLIADAASGVIENSRFKIKLDPARGVVASLVDKRDGKELVDKKSPWSFGQYLYERFDADVNQRYYDTYCKYIPGWVGHFARFDMPPAKEVPYSVSSPKDFEIDVQRTPVAVTARMTAAADVPMAHTVSLQVTLYRSQSYVDLEWTITDKEPDTWPEAGWLCLPFAVDRPSFRLGRLGSVIDPARDIIRGSNHEVFCLSTGMTVTGPDGRGVALCSPDAPLVSLGRPGVYRYTRQFSSRKPVVFVNLFNNVWGTNFQQWIDGSWSSGVRIWVTGQEGVGSGLVAPSWETRSRAKAAMASGSPGELPVMQSGIELSSPEVLVTALEPNPDGQGVLLRLWEQAGKDGTCRIRLPDGLGAVEAQPCDLRGRPQGSPIPIRDGRFEVKLSHFAPKSLVLKAASD